MSITKERIEELEASVGYWLFKSVTTDELKSLCQLALQALERKVVSEDFSLNWKHGYVSALKQMLHDLNPLREGSSGDFSKRNWKAVIESICAHCEKEIGYYSSSDVQICAVEKSWLNNVKKAMNAKMPDNEFLNEAALMDELKWFGQIKTESILKDDVNEFQVGFIRGVIWLQERMKR